MSQNWGGREPVLQEFEGLITVFRQQESGIFLEQVLKGFAYPAEPFNEPPIEIGKL